MDQVIEWFLRARHNFIWDLGTISPYADVLIEAVHFTIKVRLSETEVVYYTEPRLSKGDEVGGLRTPEGDTVTGLTTPEIGFFPVVRDEHSQEHRADGYVLHVAEVRLPPDKRCTLFAEFKMFYQYAVGSGPDWAPRWIRYLSTDERKQTLLERKKLVRNFNSLANRSLNRRRTISARLRYQVLMRDNSTCQVCGRRAPEVRLHVDHIMPLSWDTSWQPSDDPDDYQVLCEECNLGKGSLSWLNPLRLYDL